MAGITSAYTPVTVYHLNDCSKLRWKQRTTSSPMRRIFMWCIIFLLSEGVIISGLQTSTFNRQVIGTFKLSIYNSQLRKVSVQNLLNWKSGKRKALKLQGWRKLWQYPAGRHCEESYPGNEGNSLIRNWMLFQRKSQCSQLALTLPSGTYSLFISPDAHFCSECWKSNLLRG